MLRRFWLKLVRRRQLERDLEAEMAFHREMAKAGGNAIPFGNGGVIKEQALDLWRFTWIENLWRDVRFGARGLAHSPVLLLSALASLGLGIGANTALFSLATEFLLSEPSVTDAGSIASARIGGNSHAEYEVIQFVQRSGIFAGVTGDNFEAYANWNDGVETRRIFGTVTAKNFFTTLGVPVALGRGYHESDPDEVVVLHSHFWRTRFNADPSIVGRAIKLQGKPYTVVGVLPENHRTLAGFGLAPDVYLPYYKGGPERMEIYARLKPGQSLDAATAALRAVGARLDAEMPSPHFKYAKHVSVTPVAGPIRLARVQELQMVTVFFAVLLGIAGLVLLIACVNVASLLLARAAARRREMAIRVSVGAGRGRLLQQMLVESLLLALAGTAFGLLVARVVTLLLARIQLPLPIPIRLIFEPDWRLALYATLLAGVATIACGLLPALQSVKESMTHDLHREPRQRLRRVLVAAQIAVSLVVLITGFLFLRNMINAGAASPGFDTRNTIRASVNLPPVGYEGQQRREEFIRQGLRVLSEIPGVEAVAAARLVPFTNAASQGADIVFPDGGKVHMSSYWNVVTPDYFRVMDIPLVAGRSFLPTDGAQPRVVIVNRVFVRRFLNRRTPVGTTFLWGVDGKIPYQIVGVVEGTKNLTLGEGDEPQFYEPLRQSGGRTEFIIRTSLPPATQLTTVRQALDRLEPAAGAEVQTMFSAIGLAFLPSQVGAALMGAIGLLGLLLAAVGLYGTLVYSVARRAPEIAVRMAIGASKTDVARMVLGDSLRLIAWGSVFGLLAAFFITKPLAMFLVPGITPGDPVNFAVIAGVFLLVGVAAAFGPSRQAAAVDPAINLRS